MVIQLNRILDEVYALLGRMDGKGPIDNGVDLDSLLQPGVYGIRSENTYSNSPESNINGSLEVLAFNPSGGYAMQRITTDEKIYVRHRSESSGREWSSWSQYSIEEVE